MKTSKKTRPPKQAPPTAPRAPAPPATRADVTAMYLQYLTNEVEQLGVQVKEWRDAFQAQTKPELIVNDLEWGQQAVEAASRFAIASYLLEALTKEGATATMETVREYATDEALGRARHPKRSSSPMANLTDETMMMAWAQTAKDLRAWCKSLAKADEYYGAQDAPQPPGSWYDLEE